MFQREIHLLCEAYEVGWDFVIAPEQKWQQPHQNLLASHTGEGPLVSKHSYKRVNDLIFFPSPGLTPYLLLIGLNSLTYFSLKKMQVRLLNTSLMFIIFLGLMFQSEDSVSLSDESKKLREKEIKLSQIGLIIAFGKFNMTSLIYFCWSTRRFVTIGLGFLGGVALGCTGCNEWIGVDWTLLDWFRLGDWDFLLQVY